MRRFRITVAAVAMLALVLAACSPQRESGSAEVASQTSNASTSRTVKLAVADGLQPAGFADPTRIDNRWYPLVPGTQLVYDGTAIVDGSVERRRVVATVTDLTKVVQGVRNLVLWERDYSEGQLVEAELAFFAQDDDGNVWHFGQYPEEYEDGKLDAAPAWIAGFQGAKVGIAMQAAPRTGTPDYAQGLGPAVDWRDRAKIRKTGHRTCVPTGCYDDVLVTEEWDEAEPAARQLKYYAPGIGNVRVSWTGRDEEKEVLVLTKVERLGPEGLAAARRAALQLEQRAYKVSKGLYGRTQPAEPLGG
jgi:hypothetical protein